MATGLPIPPVDYEGVRYEFGQANNALLYPGLGLGTIVSGASQVTDGMLLAAAEAVAGQADVSAPGASLLPGGGEPAAVLGAPPRSRWPGAAADDGVATTKPDNLVQAVQDAAAPAPAGAPRSAGVGRSADPAPAVASPAVCSALLAAATPRVRSPTRGGAPGPPIPARTDRRSSTSRSGWTPPGCGASSTASATVEVPADRYWGAQTQRSLEHFNIGHDRMPKEVYHAYGYVKKAAAIVNTAAGRLPAWKGQLIERVCDEVISGKLDDRVPAVRVADRVRVPSRT